MYKIPDWIGSIRQGMVWLGITVGVLLLSSCTWGHLTDSLDTDVRSNMESEATSGPACQLVWSDEFDVNGLPDPDRWRYNVGAGLWGNQESQFYTDARLDNARIEDGHLIIEAHREPYRGRQYTSARLVSREEWTYGRFEVVAKLPSGRGT